MLPLSNQQNVNFNRADWEVDFYSRPIIEPDGKKRWELLIISTEDYLGGKVFQWEKQCPANEVNSVWLSNALEEALDEAQRQGWEIPKSLRCWRVSMKTMIKKAAEKVGIEVKESRRTYSLFDWLKQRELDFYPKQEGYMAGPLAPPPQRIVNQPVPLPEALRGDAWSIASLDLNTLREANEWPIEFNGLIPIRTSIKDNVLIPGLRLFSEYRSLALSAWVSGIEPVRLLIEGRQLILETGEEERWLVTDLSEEIAQKTKEMMRESITKADGLQFISIQVNPNEKKFSGFWMLRDLGE